MVLICADKPYCVALAQKLEQLLRLINRLRPNILFHRVGDRGVFAHHAHRADRAEVLVDHGALHDDGIAFLHIRRLVAERRNVAIIYEGRPSCDAAIARPQN